MKKVLRKEIPLKMHCTLFDMVTVINLAKELAENKISTKKENNL